MFALVQKHGGSISAEHGIGLLKKDYLATRARPAELRAAARAQARAGSRTGILNPGKILDS